MEALNITSQLNDSVFSVFERLDILFSALKLIFKNNGFLSGSEAVQALSFRESIHKEAQSEDNTDIRFLNGDQVFSLIVDLIETAKIPHLSSHLQFIRLFAVDFYDPLLCVYFGFSPSKSTGSLMDFYLTQFEATVEYLTRPSLPSGQTSVFYTSKSMVDLKTTNIKDKDTF